jgi:hypothetical protein
LFVLRGAIVRQDAKVVVDRLEVMNRGDICFFDRCVNPKNRQISNLYKLKITYKISPFIESVREKDGSFMLFMR